MKGPIEKIDVTFYNGKETSMVSEPVIREKLLDIFLNDSRVATIASTGIYIEELAAGFLRTMGILTTHEDIRAINVSPEGSRVEILTRYPEQGKYDPSNLFILSSGAKARGSGITKGPVTSDISISANKVPEFMEELLSSSPLHKETHGTHCSALADTEKIIVSRDDIGRHNTIDMLGGYALLAGIGCSDKVIIKTGRVSSEIAEKVWTLGIPIVISHSVPTSEAVDIVRKAGITLIGHVRGGTFKIYSNERRIRF